MNYIEALQQLVDGKKIRHKSWDKGEYAYIRECLILTNVGTTRTFSTNCLASITDDNWEIYQTEKEKLITDGKRWKILRACEMCGCENCERKQEELYKFCQRRIGSFDEILIRVSDDEVNSIYNLLKIKGEIDA